MHKCCSRPCSQSICLVRIKIRRKINQSLDKRVIVKKGKLKISLQIIVKVIFNHPMKSKKCFSLQIKKQLTLILMWFHKLMKISCNKFKCRHLLQKEDGCQIQLILLLMSAMKILRRVETGKISLQKTLIQMSLRGRWKNKFQLNKMIQQNKKQTMNDTQKRKA